MSLQYGLSNASYDLARYNVKNCIISLDFIGKNEFVPFLFLLFKKPKISNDFVNVIVM